MKSILPCNELSPVFLTPSLLPVKARTDTGARYTDLSSSKNDKADTWNARFGSGVGGNVIVRQKLSLNVSVTGVKQLKRRGNDLITRIQNTHQVIVRNGFQAVSNGKYRTFRIVH